MDIEVLCNKILSGERLALSRGITLIESSNSEHRRLATELIKIITHQSTKKSLCIAISGSPGVGKSTFIETMGNWLVGREKRVAVLAIDPSSQESGGSILGDKTRMNALSRHPLAFIRPSPSAGKYGGIGHATFETTTLCAAAGFDVIFIETLGTGQSEIEAHHVADLFLLLLQPGSGDDLQGIKRGIMEVADLLIITKDDGDFTDANRLLRQQLKPLWRSKRPDTPIMHCSAVHGTYIPEIWEQIEKLLPMLQRRKKRIRDELFWYRQNCKWRMLERLMQHYQKMIKQQESDIEKGEEHYLDAVSKMISKLEEDLGVKN